MEFLRIFEKIDKDCSGEMSIEELVQYMKDNDFDDNFAQKWLNLFDSDGNGFITIEEFCNVLGLEPREEYIEKVNDNRQQAGRKPIDRDSDDEDLGDYKILRCADNMDPYLRRFMIQQARAAQDKFTIEKDVARSLKYALDKEFGRVWQVVVGRFQYGSLVSHEPGNFMHFMAGRYAFLCWKTPDY